MRSYILKLDTIRRELAKQQLHVSDERYVARLLYFLPESWNQIVLLCRSPPRSANEVKRILIEEEESRVRQGIFPEVTVNSRPHEPPAATPEPSNPPASAPKTVPSVSDQSVPDSEEPTGEPTGDLSRAPRRKKRAFCTFCGRNGHKISSCWALEEAHDHQLWSRAFWDGPEILSEGEPLRSGDKFTPAGKPAGLRISPRNSYQNVIIYLCMHVIWSNPTKYQYTQVTLLDELVDLPASARMYCKDYCSTPKLISPIARADGY
ncbi:hypothetical protein SISNIDRAFT_467392 [Sistotremastrum niveocremeum HHB9708]|uniref:Uncharacterized protein n=1 Tax=Sistotremastrum niveocremeum HHB9708 TaxID=1314777 RepID=A0A164STT5_9AGAM|nr:hypothetical protein SISNIDRAFT_467392 [Sistotremastrum niveocremeum HHB9708]